MLESEEKELLARIAREGPATWEAFLASCSEVIFRVIRLVADSYDERMDLFLFVCVRLREDDMRRVRSFRYRSDAPCRFSTFLSVVVKNLAVDFIRSREGRFRPFLAVQAKDETDRLVFEYHLKDGRPLEEVRDLLAGRHGIRLSTVEVSDRAARVHSRLSATQRWRLLSRLSALARPASLDTVEDAARGDESSDPEIALRSREAGRVFREALASIPPRQRLALILRYRDGLDGRGVAEVLGISTETGERLAREGIGRLRDRLRGSGVERFDLERVGLASLWTA